MGVIKKSDPKVGIYSASSEESLGIPASDDEISIASSLGDTVTFHPPAQRNIPVPVSFVNRRRIGKRQRKRLENVSQLEALVEDCEQDEVSIKDFMENTNAGFTRLFSGDNMEVWYQFVESPEDTQNVFLNHNNKQKKFQVPLCSAVSLPGEREFRRIKSGMRNRLKHGHIPTGMLHYLESEVSAFFTISPHSVYTSEAHSSFERLLLHAISQYHLLFSHSITDKESHCRLVRIHNQNETYVAPEVFLNEYLEIRKATNHQTP